MKKILIVDNDIEMLELMKDHLDSEQYSVTIAADGLDGLTRAETEAPDVIILDIKMPIINGYTFVKRLKEDKSKKIPVIILTSYTNLKDHFAVEGVNDYLVKPFEIQTLRDKLNEYL